MNELASTSLLSQERLRLKAVSAIILRDTDFSLQDIFDMSTLALSDSGVMISTPLIMGHDK